MKLVLVLILGIVAASTVTYARYGSFSPCDWMQQDLAQRSDLPLLVVQGRIRADFLIQGIIDPNPYDCVLAWWKFRAQGLPVGS